MYIRIGLLVLICPFIHFIFFPIFNIKHFRQTFLRNYYAYKVETWYTLRQWVDISCILNEISLLLLLICSFVSSFFCPIFIKKFHHTFLRNCEAYKVETWYTHGQWVDVLCIPEPGCSVLFVSLFHFSFSPASTHRNLRHIFLRN